VLKRTGAAVLRALSLASWKTPKEVSFEIYEFTTRIHILRADLEFALVLQPGDKSITEVLHKVNSKFREENKVEYEFFSLSAL
jgi:hypothetical protein